MSAKADLKEIIEQLKLERDILKDGGYGRSVRTPWKPTTLFRDSVTCLNFGDSIRKHPCSDCLLWEWVPEERRDEDIPCHHIPLTETGESIGTLDIEGNREKAEEALLNWLNKTIRELEEKLAKRQAEGS
ncbi:MAG: hypothetical protein HYS33_05040 [Acidobacteria bacterium]|nr:hypothetical protein [Acidobacteriota bacterium]